MRRRRYFVGLVAGLVAVGTMIFATPAGAGTCNNSMNPANNGNSSGLIVACTFANAAEAGTSLTIDDYKDALFHAGAARSVSITATKAANATANWAGLLTVKWAGTSTTQLGPSAADVNHSMENPTSGAVSWSAVSPVALGIDAGTFIRSTTATNWNLSAKTLGSGFVCPGGAANTACTVSAPMTVRIANHTGRDFRNGATTANSGTVNSADVAAGTNHTPGEGAHFCGAPGATIAECASVKNSDVGSFLSGGDIPDGAQINTVTNHTQVVLACSSKLTLAPQAGNNGLPQWGWGDDGGTSGQDCAPGFVGTVTAATGLIMTITPFTAPTSSRYVTDVTASGAGTATFTITSSSAKFAQTDIGLPVFSGTTVVQIPTGSRIATVATGGGSATITQGSNPAVFTNGASRRIAIGVATKTAPNTGDVVTQLAIALIVDPNLSPTSPPCAAAKVSGFQIPLVWRNPAQVVPSTAGYNNGNAGPPTNHYSGASFPTTSNAQLDFVTSATTFAGFVKQTVTVSGTTPNVVPLTTGWQIAFLVLPVGIGLCTGTGIAETLNVNGISLKQALNPSFTGGGYGAVRALLPEIQGTASTYTGATGRLHGANVTAGLPAPTVNNTCTVQSPNLIQIGC